MNTIKKGQDCHDLIVSKIGSNPSIEVATAQSSPSLGLGLCHLAT